MSAPELTPAEFIAQARRNPVNAALLDRLPALGLPDAYLTAGCLFQAVWNAHSGQPADWGVNDYDLFYFDPHDLSAEAETRVNQQVQQATVDWGGAVEAKNQARVHLWYRDWFGVAYPQLNCARDGIERFLVACTCVGIELTSGALFAPNGLSELAAGVLRMNPRHPVPELFLRKAHSYQRRWPWLTVVEPG